MTNADLFRATFGMNPTKLWDMTGREFLDWMNTEVSEQIKVDKPTDKQIKYAGYLAHRMCVPLPTEFTKAAYSEFISKMKPIVKAEDDAMNEPGPWGMAYL